MRVHAENSRHAPTGTLASDMRREGTGQQIVQTGVATRMHLQAVAQWVPDKLRQALDDCADFALLVGQHCVVVELARMVELCNMS